MTLPAVAGWREHLKTHDASKLRELIDAEAVFESPILHTPQRGRDTVMMYLLGAGQVLGGPAFRFTNEWSNAEGGVLEFETEIDGVKINGVDLITCTPDGERIAHFKVMIRPLKAINLVHQRMAELLAGA